MGNVNAIAVATLTDCACIILTEDAPLDEDARQRADSQSVPVLSTGMNAYETAIKISQILK